MKSIDRKQTLKEIALILIFGLIPLLWYKPGYMGFGHDMGFPLAPVDHFLDRLYTWTDRVGPFGSNSVLSLPGLFIHGLEALLYSLGFSLLNVQRLTFIFWFVLPGLAMYILLKYIFSQKEDYLPRLSGSLFYMINHFLLQAWTIAERTKFSIVAAIPFVVVITMRLFDKKDAPLKSAILVSIILFFLNGGEGIPILMNLFLILSITVLVYFLLSKERLVSKTKRLIVYCFSTIGIWSLISSYWLYPYLSSFQQAAGQRFQEAWGAPGTVSWSQSLSSNSSWINIFNLRGIPDWYLNLTHPYASEFSTNPFLTTLNVFFVCLVFVGLMVIGKTTAVKYKTRIYLLVLLLISIPLVAGSHPPLGIVYDYLLLNLPGFALFRTAYFKFGVILWFAVSLLIAFGSDNVFQLMGRAVKNRKFSQKLPLLVLLTYIIFLISYNYPFLNGSFFDYQEGKTTMVQVPDYIFDAKKEIDIEEYSSRIFVLPNADLRTRYVEYDWGYFSLVELPHSLTRKPTIFNGLSAWPNEVNLYENILLEYKNFGSSNLVKYTGASRAIVQKDFISPDYEDNPLTGTVSSFEQSSDFVFDKSIGQWDFYNYNSPVLPRIYSPESLSYVYLVNPGSLSKIANLSVFGESFVLSDYLSTEESGLYSNFIVEAECAGCNDEKTYDIFFSYSKVFIPGTHIYNIGKLITELKQIFTTNAQTRVEQNLANSAILNTDLGKLQGNGDFKGVHVATNDLIKNIYKIKMDLKEISDPSVKIKQTRKARYFIAFFLSYESQWAESQVEGPIKDDLIVLESELEKAILEFDQNLGDPSENPEPGKYYLRTPISGKFNVYFYGDDLKDNRLNISINGKEKTAERVDEKWFLLEGLDVQKLQPVELMIPAVKNEFISGIFAVSSPSPDVPDKPRIDYIALNQTKYLIKIRETKDKLLLVFNSRFDPEWTIRPVGNKAGEYFNGEQRVYENGVVEHARSDKHLLTDIIFPRKSASIAPKFIANGFSTGFEIDHVSKEAPEEQYYLLEYNNQNNLYKAAGISIISFISFVVLYLYKYAKKIN